MPRYFFDLTDQDGDTGRDAEGVPFDDLESAKGDALRMLAALGHEHLESGQRAAIRIDIRDDEGNIVCVVRMDAGASC